MRPLLLALLLALPVLAQDPTSAAPAPTDPTDAADAPADTSGADSGDDTSGLTPAEDTGTPTEVIDLPPTLPSGPWNITYFIAPTRNNYWVNDNDNTAAWAPVNVATNLILSNSNRSIMTQPLLLVQNLAPGAASYKAKISGLVPGNNYIVALTLAGNPDQKLAQTQGFHIKPNSTAAIQQVVDLPNAGSAGPAAISGAGGVSTAPGSSPASPGGAPGAPAPGAAPGDPTPGDANAAAVPSAARRAGASLAVLGLAGLAVFVL